MDLQSSGNSFTIDDESQDVEVKLHFDHEGTQKLEVHVSIYYNSYSYS